ncbi:MAG: hypothetical protein K0S80_5105 [Neobacillus sp.]|nr:hypothetical protein [Neobacillus sp.]
MSIVYIFQFAEGILSLKRETPNDRLFLLLFNMVILALILDGLLLNHLVQYIIINKSLFSFILSLMFIFCSIVIFGLIFGSFYIRYPNFFNLPPEQIDYI